MRPTVSQVASEEESGYGGGMLSKKQLLRECTALANSPLSLQEIERLQLDAVESIRERRPNSDRQRQIMRLSSEIRKSRGLACVDHAQESLLEIERLELAAIESIRERKPDADQARITLRMTSEIRKARGLWDSDKQAMSQREIDDELAMIRGQS